MKVNNIFLNNLRQMRMTICFLMCSIFSFAQQEVPILNEIVTDNANVFDSSEEELLKNKLTSFEKETTTQIVILTIEALENETIEGYALKVFNKNKLGQKNVDNGILILFSKLDREIRIEVGYGLESTITDALASRIIRQIMIPNFKKEQYSEGIHEGVSKLIELLDNPELIEEFLATPEEGEEDTSLTVKIFSALALSPIFMALFIFGYNSVLVQNYNFQKIEMTNCLERKPKEYILSFISGIIFVVFFFTFSVKLFAIIAGIGVVIIFMYLGIYITYKELYRRLTDIFEALFSGELGVFIFPFYLPLSFLLLIITVITTFLPLFTFSFFFIEKILELDFNKLTSSFIHIKYPFYIFTSLVLITTFLKGLKRINKKGKPFSFSLFKKNLSFPDGMFSSRKSSKTRSYSNKGSFSSSSSSGSSFSGGGGSSGGGGASGNW